jgi:hypothetical protein
MFAIWEEEHIRLKIRVNSLVAPFSKVKYAGDKLVISSFIERDEGIIRLCVPKFILLVSVVDRVEFGLLIRLDDSSVSASSTT